MQWDVSPNAGFTTGKAWMRANDNYPSINAAIQVNDPDSVYHCWRQVLGIRKAYKNVFVYGKFELVDEPNEHVFAYKMVAATGDTAVVACNFSGEHVKWSLGGKVRKILISPGGQSLDMVEEGGISLGPCEAIAVLV